jgi:hypothetical protein
MGDIDWESYSPDGMPRCLLRQERLELCRVLEVSMARIIEIAKMSVKLAQLMLGVEILIQYSSLSSLGTLL